MKLPAHKILYLFIFITILSCTSNDAQESFERQAFSQAEGITQTDNNSNVVGEPDEDDWRTSPFYSAIANVEPAFPNPILYGTTATIDIDMRGNSLTSLLELGYFDFQDRWTQLDLREDISEFSTTPLTINSQIFGTNASLARGFYRVVVFDGNQRVITYGDIEIE
ncbi:MAG: hypothetical protein BalsKO_06490 [Balneolaceae bacterium]